MCKHEFAIVLLILWFLFGFICWYYRLYGDYRSP